MSAPNRIDSFTPSLIPPNAITYDFRLWWKYQPDFERGFWCECSAMNRSPDNLPPRNAPIMKPPNAPYAVSVAQYRSSFGRARDGHSVVSRTLAGVFSVDWKNARHS
jgi:hypothetical protein